MMLSRHHHLLPIGLGLAALMLAGCRSSESAAPLPTPARTFATSAAQETAEAMLMPSASPVTRIVRATLTAVRTPLRASPTLSPSPTPAPTETPAPATRLESAEAALLMGEYEQAITHYDELRYHPRHGEEASYRLGATYAQQRRWAEAVNAWSDYLSRFPEGRWAPEAHFRAGRALAAVGRHEDALAQYMAYDQARDTLDDVVATAMADSYVALEDPVNALAAYLRAYDLNTADRVARALLADELGDLYASQEAWPEAIGWYQKALADARIPSYQAELLGLLADAEAASGDSAAATRSRTRLMEEFPETTAALDAMRAMKAAGEAVDPLRQGSILYHNGFYDEAVRVLYTIADDDPHPADVHWYAALAYRDSNDLTRAIREWTSLIETHPESERHAAALLGIGRAARRQGDEVAALTAYDTLLGRFGDRPEAADALWERARLLGSTGHPQEAVKSYAQMNSRFPEDERGAEGLWRTALIQFEMGQPATAIQTLETLGMAAAGNEPLRATALFWQGKLQPNRAAALWDRAASLSGYYSLRAFAERSGRGSWPARIAWSPTPITATSALEWVRELPEVESSQAPVTTTAEATPTLAAEPLMPRLLPALDRADGLMGLGMRNEAVTLYARLLDEAEGQPEALVLLAERMAAQHIYEWSSVAAQEAMEVLDLSPTEVPPALGLLAYPLPFPEALHAAAARHGVDPLLLAAICYQESRWKPNATSVAGARGLTQVMPATGRDIANRLGQPYNPDNLYQGTVALEYGAAYLDWLLDLFDENTFAALAAYNGGPGNARRWLDGDNDRFVEKIHLSETRLYIERLYTLWHGYDAVYRPRP